MGISWKTLKNDKKLELDSKNILSLSETISPKVFQLPFILSKKPITKKRKNQMIITVSNHLIIYKAIEEVL